jgi:hypothetical protein
MCSSRRIGNAPELRQLVSYEAYEMKILLLLFNVTNNAT